MVSTNICVLGAWGYHVRRYVVYLYLQACNAFSGWHAATLSERESGVSIETSSCSGSCMILYTQRLHAVMLFNH
jgi:hypothetical protein